MDNYKIISIVLCVILYIVAMIPSFLLLLGKKTYENKKKYLNRLCLCIILEIIIFSLIYVFNRNIMEIITNKKNIQNYSIYVLKILYIGSVLTPIQIAVPKFAIYGQNKKAKGILLFALKILYIPAIYFGYTMFSMKGALFAVPACDIIYSLILMFV